MISDTHDITFMDLFIINMSISYRICDLTGLYAGNFFCHIFFIVFHRFFRYIIDHCCNTLWYSLGRNNNDIFVFRQCFCLICCQNNIFIIWQDKDMLCIHFTDRIQHVFRTRIHRLSTLDQVIHTKITENLSETFANGHRNKSYFFLRCFCCLFCLLCSNFFRIFNQFFLMFFTHVIDLDSGQRTIGKSTLDRQSRIIGMYVNLNHFIVSHAHDRITQRAEICLKVHLIFCSKFFI